MSGPASAPHSITIVVVPLRAAEKGRPARRTSTVHWTDTVANVTDHRPLRSVPRNREGASRQGAPIRTPDGRTRWFTNRALVLFSLSIVGCGGPHAPVAGTRTIRVTAERSTDQVLNRHLEADPPTLDPTLATDASTQHVLDDLFEGLVCVGEDGSTMPAVARSWSVSPNHKTWIFHLRTDARWSNGQPVTAADFVYAWRRQVDPATASEYAQALAPIENAMAIANGTLPVDRLGVDAAGPETLIVHLRAPTSYFLALLTNQYLYPIYAPAVRQWGDGWTQPGHMVSNGAFILSDRVINGHVTLLKNPYYWDARDVRLSKVTYAVVSDRNGAQDQYLAGNLDWLDRFNISDKDWLQRTLGDQVVFGPYFGTAMFAYNFTKPPFAANRNLRLALNMAIDRDILVRYVQRGLGIPAYNLIPPLSGYPPAIPAWATLSPDARHALARQLYREAGYSDAHPLETVLTFPSGGAEDRRMMEALSAMWQENLGAKVQIYNVEWKVLLQARQLKQPVLFWFGWIGDYPDPFTFMQLFESGFGMNDGDYRNVQFDSLVDQASTAQDAAAHFRLFHDAEASLNEDAAFLPISFYVSEHLIKPYVKGWQTNIMDRNLSRYMYILDHQER